MGKINVYDVNTGQREEQLDTRGKFTLSIAYVRVTVTTAFPLVQTGMNLMITVAGRQLRG